jgi:hypothetical protein
LNDLTTHADQPTVREHVPISRHQISTALSENDEALLPASSGSAQIGVLDRRSPSANRSHWSLINLKPLSASLQKVDKVYLSQKGALTLPPPAFCDICLSRYIEFVHTVLPVLDLDEFLREVWKDLFLESPGISLLLLSAVLFAAIPFVEVHHVRNAGYTSKLAARAALEQNTEVSPSIHQQI